jgi:type I restriction enzyme S subunit
MVPNGWSIESLENISKVTSGGTPSKNKSEYWDGGNIPWVRTTEVQNCTIESGNIKVYITEDGLNNSSAKLFPIGTILLAMIGQGKTRGQVALLNFEASTNQNCAAIILKKEYHPEYYFNFLLSQYQNIRNLSNSAGQSNLSGGLVKTIKVPVPPLPEQQKIATILGTWDKAISTTERLINNSKQQKKALMQQLLTGKKRLLDDSGKPFEGEWEDIKLGDVLTESTQRNKNNAIQRVLSITNHSGFVLPEEQFSKRVASNNVTNYKVVNKGEYGYNPSRINVGSFARLDLYDEGLLSPMYVVFRLNKSKLNSDYFFNWMSSNEARQRVIGSTQGSVRDSVGFGTLCGFPFKLPSLKEQQEIAAVLTNADQEIELLEQQLADLKQEKKALMQQLLTGKRRVKVDDAEAA